MLWIYFIHFNKNKNVKSNDKCIINFIIPVCLSFFSFLSLIILFH